ncbi:MAG: nucleotide exchange factor GrpE [Candidatus Atribacteria bacterium]|nr:nucleotide exchange factor GrpE [Candidatus Atribacteria bacterium]
MFDKKKKYESQIIKEKPGEKKHKLINKKKLVKIIKEKDKDKEITSLKEKFTEAENLAKKNEQYYKETLEKLLRLQAEFENYKKRQEKRQKEFIEYANQDLLSNLLTVVDNLERALESTKKEKNVKAISHGLKNILKEFHNVLNKEGVKPIESVNKKFDPYKHEAVMKEETDKHSEDIVTEEFRKGYTIKSRILRPAMVKVAVSIKEKK